MKSVFSQTYPQLEYLIIDGGSDDGTVEIVHQFRDGVDYFIREPDNGIYDAMNKGIKIATGEILFFLNSDDYFADPKVVEDVAKVYRENPKVDVVFGNQIFDKGDRRLIKKQLFKNPKIQLARTNVQHQTLFAKKKILELTGGFSTKYKIVSDYEWMLKTFLVNKCNYIYIDREISVM
ncbi:MAG: glycosyltransferase, partial [Candidatus Dadabacteria bacterium]|nr:glycosyltransferase [Candidatus Dadabacteria bacterium]